MPCKSCSNLLVSFDINLPIALSHESDILIRFKYAAFVGRLKTYTLKEQNDYVLVYSNKNDKIQIPQSVVLG